MYLIYTSVNQPSFESICILLIAICRSNILCVLPLISFKCTLSTFYEQKISSIELSKIDEIFWAVCNEGVLSPASINLKYRSESSAFLANSGILRFFLILNSFKLFFPICTIYFRSVLLVLFVLIVQYI